MQILDWTGKVLFDSSASTLKDAAIEAVAKSAGLYGADLRGADLRGADLQSADLRGAGLYGADLQSADLQSADLRGADLRGADLQSADLRGADLYGADLRGADLRGADLQSADLRGAGLYGADLQSADLRGADLRGADLRGADLQSADLRGAGLYGADLRGADLYGAKEIPTLAIAQLQFIPEEGSFVGWKKCKNDVIVKLLITDDAKRSHGTERKCRASKVVVLEVFGADTGYSHYDCGATKYFQHAIIEVPDFDEDRWNTCSTGIHFFLTRVEAENYVL